MPIALKSGSINLLELSGPLQPCAGISFIIVFWGDNILMLYGSTSTYLQTITE
jgi:hypothetical protein